jgi:hypothetical protein
VARNRTGERIGTFVVLGVSKVDHYGTHYLCQCDCGKQFVRRATRLEGNSKSCGCHRKHGDSPRNGEKGPYKTWKSMLTRCYNPNAKSFSTYGGRGVQVCQEWHEYAAFRDWMYANGWQPGLTIDRINNDGNYEPSNCQILTRSENISKRFSGIKRKQCSSLS